MEAGQSSFEPNLRREEEEDVLNPEENEGAIASWPVKDSCGVSFDASGAEASSADACAAAEASVLRNDAQSDGVATGEGIKRGGCHDSSECSVEMDAERYASGDSAADTEGSSAPASSEDTNTSKQEDQSSEDAGPKGPPFAVGDHVYRYNSFFSLHQQHGIVLCVHPAKGGDDESERREDEEGDRIEGKRGNPGGDDDDDWVLLIFDFASWNPKNPNPGNGKTISTSSSSASRSCVRVYESSHKRDKWTKVEYGVSPTQDLGSAVYHHLFSKAGSFTTAQSSPAGWVCARVEFLRLHPDVLPPYNSVSSNAECVAVWCKTGTWATLQATSLLSLTAMGQVKSTATIAGVVGTAQVTVPAAGMWGWLGYTTQVSLLTLHPVLVPAIAAYGVVTIGAPLAWLWRAKQRWKDLTVQLNETFWQFAIDDPDFFVRHVMATNSEDRTDGEIRGRCTSSTDMERDDGAQIILSKSFDQDWVDARNESLGYSMDLTSPRVRFKSV